MMSELHWTGAALLLAVAVLGSRPARARGEAIVSWADFARENGLDEDEPSAIEEPPSIVLARTRGGRSRRTTTLRAS
jgi:hypothetical protein